MAALHQSIAFYQAHGITIQSVLTGGFTYRSKLFAARGGGTRRPTCTHKHPATVSLAFCNWLVMNCILNPKGVSDLKLIPSFSTATGVPSSGHALWKIGLRSNY